MRKGIDISHVNMGGCDQSQVKIKFKKFEKSKSVPGDIPKSHNDDSPDTLMRSGLSLNRRTRCVFG